MSFVSYAFVGFVAAVVILYYAVPKKFQWMLLLAASYAFYLAGGAKTVVYLLITTVSAYLAGILLYSLNGKLAALKKDGADGTGKIKRQKKAVVAALAALNFGMLYALKYLSFTLNALGGIFPSFDVHIPDIVLPLGMSFFIFQSVGYVVDVYRGKYAAERNIAKFALFTSFFPQMVQGPISRFDNLGVQLTAPHKFEAENVRGGIQLVMWGYFKKMVIADRAAVVVASFFAASDKWGGAVTAFAVVMYCINLYCDFSGGIDITRGIAEMLGIRLEENFKRPIFARSLTEYWRRWHITLGGWMRDYVFYPISLSKPFSRLGKWARNKIGGKAGKILATSAATFIVYLIIGIWHGANFRFIFFGLWNGTIITSSLLLSGVFYKIKEKLHINDESVWWKMFSTVRTCFIVFLGRYITRAPRLLTAFALIARTFNPAQIRFGELFDGVFSLGLTVNDYIIVALSLVTLLVVEAYQEYRGSVREALAKKNALLQWAAIFIPLLVILLFGVMRGDYIASEFIYKQY